MSDVFTKCPCGAHFIYSSLLAETSRKLSLHCRACNNDYHLSNTERQREHLKNEYAVASQVEQLLDITQLSVGDVIAYQRTAWVLQYQHHAVVIHIDEQKKEVTVVEFAPELPLRKGVIVRSVRNFNDDIATQNAWVRRYMPLDCLPVHSVVQKVEGFIDNRAAQPAYDITRCNCQHLSSWCKTGKMISNEADKARSYYHIVYHSFQIISMFAAPQILMMGAAVDTAVRVMRILRTEKDLIEKEMKNPWEALRVDAASIAITAVLVVGGLVLHKCVSKKRQE